MTVLPEPPVRIPFLPVPPMIVAEPEPPVMATLSAVLWLTMYIVPEPPVKVIGPAASGPASM